MRHPEVQVEGFFDCSSPNAYLGFHHLEAVARKLGINVLWKPILVGGVFNAVNKQVYTAREAFMAGAAPPAKAAWMVKDMQDWAQYVGIELHFPPKCGHPVNSARCMRACIVAESLQLARPFAKAAFEALWVHGLDLARDETLLRICADAGVDAQFLLNAIETPDIKQKLRNNTDELIARNGFGTPTFYVNGDMYFGNDRVLLVEAAVRRALETSDGAAKPN